METPCTIEFVDASWPRLAELEQVIYDILYADFGVSPVGDWRQPVGGTKLAVALCEGDIIGTASLVGSAGDERLQLRQVAVLPDARTGGVGRALVTALECWAASEGAREIWLNARQEAFGFYERLGYEYTGPMFVSELTQIPHRPMSKPLA